MLSNIFSPSKAGLLPFHPIRSIDLLCAAFNSSWAWTICFGDASLVIFHHCRTIFPMVHRWPMAYQSLNASLPSFSFGTSVIVLYPLSGVGLDCGLNAQYKWLVLF